jgi:hypothetical protein
MESKKEYFNIDAMKYKYNRNMKEKYEKNIKLVVDNIKKCLENDGYVRISLDPFTVCGSDDVQEYELDDDAERDILREMKIKLDYCKVGDCLMFEFK